MKQIQLKIFLLIINTLAIISCFSQKHVQVFDFLANTQIPDRKQLYSFYYIVDSSIVYKSKGLNFYAFTFSEDSTERTGYISYDFKSGDLVFTHDTLKRKETLIRKLFPLRSNILINSSFIKCLGNQLVKSTHGDTTTFIVNLTRPFMFHDSHSIYLDRLEFKKGFLYPTCLIFFFPFEENNGKVRLTSTSR